MPPTTLTTTNLDHPTVTVPWGHKQDLPREIYDRVLETCRRGDKGHCINTNLVRAFAAHQGRKIRSPGTYKGDFHWSELIEEQWGMFIAPLSLPYAKILDKFDYAHRHFKAPVKCPMGPVRFVGFCVPRRDISAIREARRARVNARVEAGELVPGARFREPQTPYVLAQNGTV